MSTKANKQKPVILAIDGNWYLHRCFHTTKTNRDFGTVLAQNFIGLVCKDALAVRATHVLVAFDGDMVFRYKIFPEYKASRNEGKSSTGAEDEGSETESAKEVYDYLPQVKAGLLKAGIEFVHPKKYEADDVLASVAAVFGPLGYEVILGTEDKDQYQSLITPNIRLYVSSHKPEPSWITGKDAAQKKKVPVRLMVDYQTLIGDRIDGIPNIGSIGPATASKALVKYGSIRGWYDNADEETKRLLKRNQVNLTRNRKLVKMVTTCHVPELGELKLKVNAEATKVTSGINSLPKTWFDYKNFVYPRSKGLFG